MYTNPDDQGFKMFQKGSYLSTWAKSPVGAMHTNQRRPPEKCDQIVFSGSFFVPEISSLKLSAGFHTSLFSKRGDGLSIPCSFQKME